MSPGRQVFGLDHDRQALHRRQVGLLEAAEDDLQLGTPGTLESVQLAELAREDDQLLVHRRHLGVLIGHRRRPEGRMFVHHLGSHVAVRARWPEPHEPAGSPEASPSARRPKSAWSG